MYRKSFIVWSNADSVFAQARALEVIVWLGSEDGDSNFAIQSLRGLGSSFVLEEEAETVSTPTGEYTESMLHWRDPEASARDCQALANLLERPWWHRVWIRQEAFFADEDTCIVLCGSEWLSLADLRRAIYWITTFGLGNPRGNDLLRQAYLVCLRKDTSIPSLLDSTRFSDCKDPRDRVYGILGILEAANRILPVKIDYSASNSVEELYEDVMLEHVYGCDTLHMLRHAGLWQGLNMRPTWVPDWRGRGERAVSLDMENAASHFDRPECEILGGGVLRVLASCAGRVSKVHVLESKEQSEQESWRELAMLFFDNSDSVAAHVAIGHASSVLCSIPPFLNAIKPDLESITAEIKQYVTYLYGEAPKLNKDHRRLLKVPRDILSHIGSGNLFASVRILRERKAPLLFLPNGYFGLGPTGVKLNDEIWAILGSQALIVLREVLSKNEYEVVGPCSVHGFNSGEAILGPLPAQYTVVPHLLDSEGYTEPHYLDTTTGKASRWDPRIAWAELEAHPPMNDSRFEFAQPGETPRVRPDSEYLRRHNIYVQYIDLV